jgi:hypothetical protein
MDRAVRPRRAEPASPVNTEKQGSAQRPDSLAVPAALAHGTLRSVGDLSEMTGRKNQ